MEDKDMTRNVATDIMAVCQDRKHHEQSSPCNGTTEFGDWKITGDIQTIKTKTLANKKNEW